MAEGVWERLVFKVELVELALKIVGGVSVVAGSLLILALVAIQDYNRRRDDRRED
jgi:uncharacterized protein YjeT (DUF2065 family)